MIQELATTRASHHPKVSRPARTPLQNHSSDSADSPRESPAAGVRYTEVRFEYTPNFRSILQQLGASLVVSTYQAGKVAAVGVAEQGLSLSFYEFERAMGLAVQPERMAVGTRRQIQFLCTVPEATRSPATGGGNDSVWIPRFAFHTGNIHGHELTWGNDGLWVVNTLFSCLCTLHEEFSFVPRWRPSFITELAGQDRCHLNGLALERGEPRYVTAMAESNEPAGWRATKAHSGCVIDVPSGQTVARGFAMPHSPRLYNGRLWVLDSGNGSLETVDPNTGRRQVVDRVPGYTRGLAFCGQYAFVGLSKIRETSVFGGIPIAERRDELRCGVAVIDLAAGRTVATLQFHSGVDEIFAVEVLDGSIRPAFHNLTPDEDAGDMWVVPAPGQVPHDSGRIELWRSAFSGTVTPAEEAELSRSQQADRLAEQARQLAGAGRGPEANRTLEAAVARAPARADLLVELGNLCQESGDQVAPLRWYRRAAAAQPDCVAAHQNLGYLLLNHGETAQALKHYARAETLRPHPMNRLLASVGLPVIYESVEHLAQCRCRLEACLRELAAQGTQIDTTDTTVPTSFLVAYHGRNDREVMQHFAQALHGAELCPVSPRVASIPRGVTWRELTAPRPKQTKRRIRVGFLSRYFRDHTIGHLNLGRISGLSRDDFEVVVLSAGRFHDPIAQAFQQTADKFVSLSLSISEARRQIAELDLDLLVFTDVGMDPLTSTLAHSRIAPVQCTTWGHPDTTGSPTMDFFISSELLETPDADDHYTERLLRLPNLGTYFARPKLQQPARDREFFALRPDRHVYLCPQTLYKFHPEFDRLLAGILSADPLGDIVLIDGRVPNWTRRLKERFRRTLPDADTRVRFVNQQPRADFLHLLRLADVVLDPIHFGGGHTSYESLGLEVPVVTLPGEFLRSRITLALYRRMGVLDAVVDSADSYVELATTLATDQTAAQRLRQRIAERNDVLFENVEEVRAFEDCLKTIV